MLNYWAVAEMATASPAARILCIDVTDSTASTSMLRLTALYHESNGGWVAVAETEFSRIGQGEKSMSEQNQVVLTAAQELFQRNPDWVTFFREVLGTGGIARRSFPTPTDMANFEQTAEYNEIQIMLAKLRGRSEDNSPNKEATRVITVRLPQSLHESLRSEAHDRQTSMNKLCISKLLQMVDGELVPAER
jgi:predicted HicB family RNase H-like nuclease